MKTPAVNGGLLPLLVGAAFVGQAAAKTTVAPAGTATVTVSQPSGTPEQLASGMIYGIPAQKDQIPAHFYEGMGFRFNLAGAAQTPTLGWYGGIAGFNARFLDTFNEYATTLQHGGEFQLRLSDLWGSDGGENNSDPFPGDVGNWTEYDMFLDAIVQNIQQYKMESKLSVEIWNEGDGGFFWQRSQEQFLDMWGRGFPKLKAALGTDIPLIGPSFANAPGDTSWWPALLSFVKDNGTAPDVYTWHAEAGPGAGHSDPQLAAVELTSMLQSTSLPIEPFCVNEYATAPEQQSGGAAWYISRLERNNLSGLRGNWADGDQLHDFLANLVSKPNAGNSMYNATGGGYYANGEWRVYNYYAKTMTGQRVATEGSADNLFDVYATSDGSISGVKILAGTRLATGTWAIQVNGLSKLGYPAKGKVSVKTLFFDFNGIYGFVGKPVDQGVLEHKYDGDSVEWTVQVSNSSTAYAFEFVV